MKPRTATRAMGWRAASRNKDNRAGERRSLEPEQGRDCAPGLSPAPAEQVNEVNAARARRMQEPRGIEPSEVRPAALQESKEEGVRSRRRSSRAPQTAPVPWNALVEVRGATSNRNPRDGLAGGIAPRKMVVEAVASEAVSALQEPRNLEKQGIFALSGLEFSRQKTKICAVTVTCARSGPKINREF